MELAVMDYDKEWCFQSYGYQESSRHGAADVVDSSHESYIEARRASYAIFSFYFHSVTANRLESLLRNYILVVDNRYYNYRYDVKGLKTAYAYAKDEVRTADVNLVARERNPLIKTHIFLWPSVSDLHNGFGRSGSSTFGWNNQ